MPDELAVLFLDTNVLLHFKSLREIDWKEVAGAKTVRLVLCSPVLNELDEHKYNPRLKDRADTSDVEIQQIEDGGGDVRAGVCLEVLVEAQEPSGNQDAGVIRRVVRYREENPGTRVAIATGDTNMGRRCRAQGVEVVRLGCEWRRPAEDNKDRKLRQLQQENERLKNRLPVLTLLVSLGLDGRPTDCLNVTLKKPDPFDTDRAFREMRKAYDDNAPTEVFLHRVVLGQYNEQVEGFFEEYRDYLKSLQAFEERRALTLPLMFWLENSGTAPAKEVDVKLDLSAFQTIISDHELRNSDIVGRPPRPAAEWYDCPALPRMPTPPYTPMHQSNGNREVPESPYGAGIRRRLEQLQVRLIRTYDLGHFEGVSTSGLSAVMECPSVKHNMRPYFGTVFAILRDWNAVKPFSAPYEIRTESHPDVIRKTLTFQLSVSNA